MGRPRRAPVAPRTAQAAGPTCTRRAAAGPEATAPTSRCRGPAPGERCRTSAAAERCNPGATRATGRPTAGSGHPGARPAKPSAPAARRVPVGRVDREFVLAALRLAGMRLAGVRLAGVRLPTVHRVDRTLRRWPRLGLDVVRRLSGRRRRGPVGIRRRPARLLTGRRLRFVHGQDVTHSAVHRPNAKRAPTRRRARRARARGPRHARTSRNRPRASTRSTPLSL